jgi:tetratricopeptide (TPR) repeat protein
MPGKFFGVGLTGFTLLISLSALGQTPAPPPTRPTAPGLIRLTGEDEKRTKELDDLINKAVQTERWDEAIAKAEELLALRTRVQGAKHFETVNAEWILRTLRRVASMPDENRVAYRSSFATNAQAEILYSQRKYTAAQPLYEKVLDIHRRVLTDEHPYTATSYTYVGDNLAAQGKYAVAQPLYQKALEIRRRLLTDDHPDTALSYNNAAHTFWVQGKHAQAQPLFERALEINRRLHTDNHPETARSYQNLAAALFGQAKYAEAQPLFEKALEIRRHLLTDDHPDTARSYGWLAANLGALGKYAAAEPFCEKVLEVRRRLLSDDHPDTAQSYNNLALNLKAQGNYAAAQPLYEKALEIRRRLFSDDHPDTASTYAGLAANLDTQGKYAEAQPLFEKSLEIHKRLLTDDHPDTASSYIFVAANLNAQRKYAQAQPLFEKALEIRRRLLTDDHPDTAVSYGWLATNLNAQAKYASAQVMYEKALVIFQRAFSDDHHETAAGYNNVAFNLNAQGMYVAAQRLFEKALHIRRRLLGDDHPATAGSYDSVAMNLNAQGKYEEARDRWLAAAKSRDAARLRFSFSGLDRAVVTVRGRSALAAVQARLGQPAEAWQSLEGDLGRGLLDELAARKDRRLTPGDRGRLRELTATLERLDGLVDTLPQGLERDERAKRFEDLSHQRELASIALGEFQTKLVDVYGPMAGQVAKLNEIQAALPADAALIAWVDIAPMGPNAADPDGEHWGVVVRSRGTPAWVPISATGPNGLWTKDDEDLASRVRAELRSRPDTGRGDLEPLVEGSRTQADPQPLVDKLRIQRLEPLSKALGAAADGQPPARRLIVLPSPAMSGIPIEVLLASDDTRTVSYAPSATVFKYLREQPRPDRHAGLLALGSPVYERHDGSSEPKPLPDHGLLVNMVAPGSNAATHGVKPGDVLLAYNGTALFKREDLKAVPEPGQAAPVEIWREGRVAKRELAPGKLGVVFDNRPAPVAITEQRRLEQVLVAARSGDGDFAPLPGTRYEVQAIADLFKSDDRPAMALFGADASEPNLDRLATSGELSQFGLIHLATHGVIDEAIPQRSAVILTQTGLPDPLEQVMNHKPVFDGRRSVREIQHDWELKADLVTLSACETALGRAAGGEGFVGFTQALLMSGTRSVCLSLWKVDDTATALLMQRFYANLLGHRPGQSAPLPKAEALAEAKGWLRELTRDQVAKLAASLSGGEARSKGAEKRKEAAPALTVTADPGNDHPYAHPYYWAAFVLVGDPD